jgi:hypothetical protein
VARADTDHRRLMCCRVRVRAQRRWGCGGQEDRRHVGGAVGRRGAVAVDGGGAGMVVTDDGTLALHHGEGESEVRWGQD